MEVGGCGWLGVRKPGARESLRVCEQNRIGRSLIGEEIHVTFTVFVYFSIYLQHYLSYVYLSFSLICLFIYHPLYIINKREKYG